LLLLGCSAGGSDAPPASGAGGSGAGGGGPAGGAPSGGGVSNGAGGASTGAKGCGTTTLLDVPDDPGVRGPWKVGVRTVHVGRLTAEIVYPAQPGSEANVPEATYDVRDWLPASERSKVPDSASPAVGPIGGDLYRDLPIDAAHGPYPVVVFIHGTASFRIASGSTMVHWASRGFVVIGADYPGLFLADQLCAANTPASNGGTTPPCSCAVTGQKDIPGDVNTQLQALSNPSGDLAFLAGHIDMQRIAISGHSQGACVAAGLSTLPNVEVVIPMTGSLQVLPSSSLKSVMFIAGMSDKVIGWDTAEIGNAVCLPIAGQASAISNKDAYNASAGPPAVKKRLVGITGGGHLVPTDLCQTNALGRNAVQEAEHDGVCGIDQATIIGLPAIFDCGNIDMATGIHAVSYASTAALEETLLCKDRSAVFANIKTTIPAIGDFEEQK
jgi:acetyl esterase/lipase